MRFPLREMGYVEDDVQATAEAVRYCLSDRTDCG